MDQDISNLENKIRQNMYEFLLALKTSKSIKYDIYSEMNESMKELLFLHKSVPTATKLFLSDLYSFPYSVKNEIPYSEDKSFLSKVSKTIEKYFGQLLAQELPTARKANVPRVH